MSPCTIAHQAPLSRGFPKQEYWSELLFPSPGNLSDPGIASGSPALSGGFFTLSHLGSPIYTHIHIYYLNLSTGASQVVLVVKNPAANAGDIRDTSSIPGLGRSSGGGHGNPVQYSCLENPMDRGVWQVTVHGLARVRHNWSDLAHTSIYTVFCLWDHIKYVLSEFFFFFSLWLCILLPVFLKISFNFMQSNSSVIYFMNCTFDIVAKKSLFNPRWQRFSPHQVVVMTWRNRTLLYYLWKWQLLQPLWKIFGKYLKCFLNIDTTFCWSIFDL